MDQKEARDAYFAEWPALNAAKESAIRLGDKREEKRCRQQLSQLSYKYRDRFTVDMDPWLPDGESVTHSEDDVQEILAVASQGQIGEMTMIEDVVRRVLRVPRK